jgi:capsular polysaccharide biosynthesis protein
MLYAKKKQDAIIYSDRKKRNLANVSIADRAVIPNKFFFPNRIVFFLISIFVGTTSALGLPFFLEFIDHRIKHAIDVEELLSLPVICSIPLET